MPSLDKLPVLLVEDSEDDLFFFKRLCKKAGLTAPLAVATDGQQAIHHLAECLKGTQPIPRLIFLDLKLPLRSGFEVLEWLRAQPPLARTTVVVLSSSAEARDVARAYHLGAQGYLVKYPEAPILMAVAEQVDGLAATAELSELALPGLVRP